MCLAIAASSAIAGDDDLIKVQHTPSGSSASDVSVNELELVEEPTYDFDDFVTAVSNTADEAAKHTGKQKLQKQKKQQQASGGDYASQQYNAVMALTKERNQKSSAFLEDNAMSKPKAKPKKVTKPKDNKMDAMAAVDDALGLTPKKKKKKKVKKKVAPKKVKEPKKAVKVHMVTNSFFHEKLPVEDESSARDAQRRARIKAAKARKARAREARHKRREQLKAKKKPSALGDIMGNLMASARKAHKVERQERSQSNNLIHTTTKNELDYVRWTHPSQVHSLQDGEEDAAATSLHSMQRFNAKRKAAEKRARQSRSVHLRSAQHLMANLLNRAAMPKEKKAEERSAKRAKARAAAKAKRKSKPKRDALSLLNQAFGGDPYNMLQEPVKKKPSKKLVQKKKVAPKSAPIHKQKDASSNDDIKHLFQRARQLPKRRRPKHDAKERAKKLEKKKQQQQQQAEERAREAGFTGRKQQLEMQRKQQQRKQRKQRKRKQQLTRSHAVVEDTLAMVAAHMSDSDFEEMKAEQAKARAKAHQDRKDAMAALDEAYGNVTPKKKKVKKKAVKTKKVKKVVKHHKKVNMLSDYHLERAWH